MKLFVIGATGGVGKEILKQALEAGHEVTAYVRNASKVDITHQLLHIVTGDGLDLDNLSHAVAGHDAVICTVGNNGMKPTTLMSDVVRNLIQAMKQQQVGKIVYCASAGIHKELPGVMGKMVMFMLKNPLADHTRSYELLEKSGLEWTVVRPMGLTNEDKRGPYQKFAHLQPPTSQKISRAAVAHFMLEAVTTEAYNQQSIGLSY